MKGINVELNKKIQFILETTVRTILHETSTIGRNKRTLGTLTDQHKKDLRILFDAELSFQCGDINYGGYKELLNQHHLT